MGVNGFPAGRWSHAVLAVDRCLSVCLSHWCIVSKRLKISSYFFSTGQPHHSSFWDQAPLPNSNGNPSAGGANTRGWENLRFSTKIAVYLRNGNEIGPWLLWNVNRKSQVADRSVSVLMTFCDLEKRDARVKFFRRIFAITLAPFD